MIDFGDCKTREFAIYEGDRATNNIVELKAVGYAIDCAFDVQTSMNIKDFKTLSIITDSRYVKGVLTEPWKPKKNIQLISEIKSKIAKYGRDKIVIRWIRGHSGCSGNLRADYLANDAINHHRTKKRNREHTPHLLPQSKKR